MTTILHELRLALRRLLATPGYAGLAVLTLALGTGASIAIFSLINALFLRPLDLPDVDRLVGGYEHRGVENRFAPLSYPDYADYRDATRVFSDLAAHYPTSPLSLRADDVLREINGSVVTGNYFSLLGVEPAHGRFFLPEEDATLRSHPVAVISHRLWQSHLGGRDDVLGTVLRLNDTPFTVVGVAPASFTGVRLTSPSDVWMPTMMAGVGYRWCDVEDRDCTFVYMIGRLAPERTLDEARAEMDLLSRNLRRQYPSDGDEQPGISVAPLASLHPSMREAMAHLAGRLFAAAMLVVLVAAASLGGLLVTRGIARGKESAVRLALGAPRTRLVSLFLSEMFLLSIAGAAGGLLVAGWLGRIVALFYSSQVPLDLGADATVVGYAAVLSLVTAFIAGLVPAIQASRPSLVPALKDVGPTMGRHGRPALLGLLVVVQVALSFVLLTSTGLLVKSLTGLVRFGDLDPSKVALMRLRPRQIGYNPERSQAFSREVIRRLEALPGVHSASLGQGLARGPYGDDVRVRRPGDAATGGPEVRLSEVAPRFFETNGVQLLQGREFQSYDDAGSAPVVIVNQTLADILWPDGSLGGDRGGKHGEAVGQLVHLGDDDEHHQVVGVVQNPTFYGLHKPIPLAYKPYWRNPNRVDARVAVRTVGDAAPLLPVLLRTVHAIDPAVPVTETGTLRGRLPEFFPQTYLLGRVLAATGGLAVVLAAVGLYGVLAMAVARRTREIGIRMALGGTRTHVVRVILRDAMMLVAVALGLGLAVSLAVNQTLALYLYGVSPRDPSSFLFASVVLAVVSLVASWRPARRAADVDPLVALQEL